MTGRTETSYQQAARSLREILGLEREPVAVKFLQEDRVPEGFQLSDPRRYCQLLMGASRGQSLVLTADNIVCPAAAWALGLKEPPAQLSTGQMPAAMGIFGSAGAAKNTLSTMSRLQMGKYKMVAACPLAESPFDPDVIVIESDVEHLMWVALAPAFATGGRFQLSTAILQATCVDATVIPFLEQRLNASLGCYGCRKATDMEESECVLGFPSGELGTITESLGKLNQKALPRVRSKTVYKALQERQVQA